MKLYDQFNRKPQPDLIDRIITISCILFVLGSMLIEDDVPAARHQVEARK